MAQANERGSKALDRRDGMHTPPNLHARKRMAGEIDLQERACNGQGIIIQDQHFDRLIRKSQSIVEFHERD